MLVGESISELGLCQPVGRWQRQRRAMHAPGNFGKRAGCTILELLVAFGVIGVLFSILLPALGLARESARRLQCTHQLRQIGVALHIYHDLYQCLPAGYQWERTHQSAYGWSVPLLPLLEQEAVFRQTDRNRSIHDAVNMPARRTSVAILLCPSDINEPIFTLFLEDEGTEPFVPLVDLPTSSYCGVFGTQQPDLQVVNNLGNGTFSGNRPVRFAQMRRGLSNTIVVGERTMARLPTTWLGVDSRGDDAACRLVGIAEVAPGGADCDDCDFDSRHPAGGNFLHGDGRCALISASIDTRVYQQLARLAAD